MYWESIECICLSGVPWYPVSLCSPRGYQKVKIGDKTLSPCPSPLFIFIIVKLNLQASSLLQLLYVFSLTGRQEDI